MEPEIQYEGLVIIQARKAISSHYRPIVGNHVGEEQRIHLDHQPVQTPSTKRMIQTPAFVEVTTTGDNLRVLHNSAGEPVELDLYSSQISFNPKQVFSNCTETHGHRTRPRQTKYSLIDFIDYERCKYVSGTGKTSCDASDFGHISKMGHPRIFGNWLNGITGVASVSAEESWPPRIATKTKNAKKRSASNCQCGMSNTVQDFKKVQEGNTQGTFRKVENHMNMTPMLLMLNKDFIVTSPLKENLLLTLALMAKHPPDNVHSSNIAEGETKRQVLVGQFKAFSSFLNFMLGRDAMRVRTESNAGGTSTISESLSVEYFVRRFHATDVVTEMEVEYRSFNWKKVDYICTLYGQRVGVSVTRAMSFPDPKDFSAQMAYRLLYKKLFGLVVARHGVSERHSFSQCILHVWCETRETAQIIQREYNGVSQELDIANDVVMVLTVADGGHSRPIFYESILRSPPK